MGIQVQTSTITGAGRDITNAALNGISSRTSSSADASDVGNGDSVSLSGVSNLIALAKDGSSPARQSKVDQLASLFRSGQYQANVSDVSRAMVQDLIVG